MFQYSIKELFKKIYMNPGNENGDEITFLIHLFTEITLWYTMYVHWRIERGGKRALPPHLKLVKVW